MNETPPKTGDLRVWWIPQIPMESFNVPVSSVEEGVKILRVLAEYDLFQLAHNVKPDYSNVGGLSIFSEDADGDGHPDWIDWIDEETGEDNPEEWLEQKSARDATPVRASNNEASDRDRIYLALWDNPGYLPDPVADSFRLALVDAAIKISKDEGGRDPVEIITAWLKHNGVKQG